MFHFALPEGATTPMLRGALMVHGESVAMENTLADVLTIPSLPAGVYLSEVRADGVCVLYGHVEVLPSPLSGDAGLATYRIDVDNTTDVLVVNVTLSDDAAMCAQAVTKATQAAELAGGSEVAAAPECHGRRREPKQGGECGRRCDGQRCGSKRAGGRGSCRGGGGGCPHGCGSGCCCGGGG